MRRNNDNDDIEIELLTAEVLALGFMLLKAEAEEARRAMAAVNFMLFFVFVKEFLSEWKL